MPEVGRLPTAIAFCCVGAACGPASERSTDARARVEVLGPPAVIVSQESDALAGPIGLVVDRTGRLHVLDRVHRSVLSFSPDGGFLRSFGRPGTGPGEFSQPRAMGLDSAQLRVFDAAQHMVHTFSDDGVLAGTLRLQLGGAPLGFAFGGSGKLAYTRQPASEAGLVHVLDPSGRELRVVAARLSDESLDPTKLLAQVRSRRLPDFMRNRALAAFADDGGLWVFLQSEARLQRYDTSGTLTRDLAIEVPEQEAIVDEFYRWYAGRTTLDGIRFLDQLDALVVHGDSPWLLWRAPAGGTGSITVHGADGAIRARLVLPGTGNDADSSTLVGPPASRRLAIDEERRRLYLLDSQSASLLSFTLPGFLFPESPR